MLSVESREMQKKGTGNSGIPSEQAISGVCLDRETEGCKLRWLQSHTGDVRGGEVYDNPQSCLSHLRGQLTVARQK